MDPFLRQVASFLYDRHGSNISNISVVFPGRRSGVFFNAYLNEIVEKPVLGPEVITINELISQLSNIQISDQISLILRLHQIYTSETGHIEQLDDFFFWGEILLNDFNDVDKYLLDANDLFRNITDLKEIEGRFDYLTAEQKHALEMFWGSIGKSGTSDYQEKFLKIWNKLSAIYHKFRKELLAENVGYSGLVYRNLIEKINDRDFKISFHEKAGLISEHYIFAGFNALNACENKLFRWFKAQDKADFFWDYDARFVSDTSHEAGLFIRKNLIEFPVPQGFYPGQAPSALKKIQLVSVSGQVSQAQVVNQKQFLPESPPDASFDDTALVLADENLLIPVVSAAGCRFKSINITMGYPLQNTPVFSLIGQLVELQKNYRKIDDEDAFYHKQVLSLLNHQLLTGVTAKRIAGSIIRENKIYVKRSDLKGDNLLELIFARQIDWQGAAKYFKMIIERLATRFPSAEEDPVRLEAEYLYQSFLVLQRLVDILESFNKEDISLSLFYRIFILHLQRITIPFEGEPLSGLQVMGVLETRALDFKRLVIFSVNEGKLPKTSTGHTFIPYNLRKAFGLPAYEEEDAIYAYYFYRLIHRAENVVLVFDSSTDGLNSGEMSRYLFQLLYDTGVSAEFFHLDFDFKAPRTLPISIRAQKSHQQLLLNRYAANKLSPSALNTYLDCKLKFYFRYLAGIRESDEVMEDVDPRLFGNLFHHAAELIYSEFKGIEVTKAGLQAVISNPNKIGKAVRLAFAKEYYKNKDPKDVRLTGKNILIADNLQLYLEKMLENDINYTPFMILDLEGNYEADFQFMVEGEPKTIKLGGIVDRIDKTIDGIRIIDYKTGRGLLLNFKDFEEFYDRHKGNRPKEIFQTLVYSEILRRQKNDFPILPAIYKISEFFTGEFEPRIRKNQKVLDYDDIAGEFVQSLEKLLGEIVSVDNLYDQTPKLETCKTCSYNIICRRSCGN